MLESQYKLEARSDELGQLGKLPSAEHGCSKAESSSGGRAQSVGWGNVRNWSSLALQEGIADVVLRSRHTASVTAPMTKQRLIIRL